MQLDFFDVPSPCIGMCQSNDKGHCLGCLRSREERLNWKTFNNDEKQKIIKRCVQRKRRKANKAQDKEKTKKVEALANDVDRQPSLFDPSPKVKTEVDNDLDFSDFEL